MQIKHLFLAGLMLLLAGCGTTVVNPVTGETERTVMSENAEIAQGQKSHQQVLKEYGVYANPAVQAYVNTLGQNLAAQSHRAQLKWTFTVLDSPEINAFALPGGFVYVTRGIMAYMESEADLAGVIGHEIGHVTARHGAQRATSQQNAGLGVLAASIFGAVLESQGVAGAGQLANQVSQSVADGFIASYGREQELQADGLGAEYLSRVRYDPRNMINVIRVLKNQEQFAIDQAKAEGRAAPSRNNWLASHPSNDQRLEAITHLADQYRGNDSYNDEGRDRYLKVLAGMHFGDSPAQGLVRGRNFYHPALGIALTSPVGWQIQNTAEQLAVVNGAGDAAIVLRSFPVANGKNQEELIRSVLKPSQGRAEALTINGLQATRFSGVSQNAQGQTQALELTVVAGPGGKNYALQTSAKDAGALQRARAGLREIESSFRAMTASDRQAGQPWVIKLQAYPAGGFAELAKASGLANAQQQLRLINGFYSGGEPKVGQTVKVIATP